MTRLVTVEERRARLARRHLLLPETRVPSAGPRGAGTAVAAVADSVVALHSSDPVTVYLSAMARMAEPSVGAVERALYDERTVVRHHAMRRTLWVATPPVMRLMHAAATRALVGPERRRTARLLADNGIADPDAWLADAREQVLAVLAQHGPMTARELGRAVPALTHKIVMAPGKSYSAEVSAHTRVLLGLGFEGLVVRTRPTGTWVNGAYTYASMRDWLDGVLDGGLDGVSEREAARELALLWLRRFGPGTTADLQWWTGWTAAATRRALADCAAVTVEVETGQGVAAGWLAPGDEDAVAPVEPWAALLPGLDPTTMGWKERAWYLPPQAAGAFDRMGNAGPTVWVDGSVVGVWDQVADGSLRTHLFDDLPAARRRQVAERAGEVAAMIGDTRFTVRFPSPVSTALRKGAALG